MRDTVDAQPTSYRKWFILIAGCCTNAVTIGFPFNMSVLYVEWLGEFGRSNFETAIVQSSCTGVIFIGGIAAGFAVTKYGPRKCGVFGGVITAIGLTSSFFATSIIYLVLLIGIVAGFGLSVCNISASTCVTRSFSNGKAKILALSFLEFGAGIGSIAFPVLLETLTVEYGWRGTLLLVGGIMFNLVVCATVYKLPGDDAKSQTGQNQDSESLESEIKIRHTREATNKEQKSLSKNSFLKTMVVLFQNKIFLLYNISVALCFATFGATFIFFIDLFQSKGISRTDAVMIYLYMNIVDTVCRLLLGFLKQIPHISVLFISALGALLGCFSSVAFPFLGSSYSLNLIVAIVYRIGNANMIAAITMSVVKLVGQDHYSVGLGLNRTVIGIFQIIAGPISGYIRDVTGNYDASFFSASAALFLSSSSFFTIMVYRHFQNRNTSQT